MIKSVFETPQNKIGNKVKRSLKYNNMHKHNAAKKSK